ncbi:Rrf2 family transcriptional regulator [Ornithobacterium rhinotracheale]|uniref:Rrf2 family transcriptional regulator n=2 Tax=Ornithobacterium rhinotracheale TaxID=28251 RepID=A0A410JPS8_ORNRH|nr:Rrf2 family transcriptional regulator [Ornithobacterium rhinotracheale]AFL96827.1 rrf2 family protein, putative transcriptional regulator [Ornithobacterium rhinotracheale DSM 15997]AIP99413.1 Rrf2 family transcriptional regulator [Ornithobacterium rhinotracheale ORT-UMN 88]KGB66461.1 Rrf2 family transcriptional regulator [Ornithobacterium rhinotracheale H06-030791]MBN3663085.1 Rrf2 family transcriptional regulator [Ornithobacterium rhinotracheale]MCK0194942.1 Rrf2 family transcriptional reg
MFSKTCEYGIRATIFIATQSLDNKRVRLKEIAKEINTPEAFTAKILQDLAKHDLISSIKGPYGGFEISIEQLKEIKLSQIVDAIDGDKIYNGCGLGFKECNKNNPCPIHDKFKKVRQKLKKMLETTTLYELAIKVENGNAILKL